MQRIVTHLIYNRRFWRRVEMSELSELYISMSLKTLALSLVAIFIPVYLYELGYQLSEIAFYYLMYFLLRLPLNIMAAYLTAAKGPKHTLSYSYVTLMVNLWLFLTLPDYSWPLIVVAMAQALFNSLFFVAYHVDFSKVEDGKHAGRQLSTMNIVVRLAATIGPFASGLIATFYGIHISLLAAIVLLMVAMWPLMQTAEPIHARATVNFAAFKVRDQWRNIVSYVGESISRQATLIVWPLFLAVFIFTDDTYAKIGFVASISIGTSIMAERYFGRLIDRSQGKRLLNGAALLAAVVNPLRVFAQNIGMVTLVNLTMELSESGQILAFSRGVYGEADASRDRIGYITAMETAIAGIRAVLWLVLLLGFVYFDARAVFYAMFILAGAASLLVPAQSFQALRTEER
jgi:MFS family permease